MARRKEKPEALAQLFRVLGDPSRLRIVTILCKGEKNVSQICRALHMSQPTVSRHLSILKMTSLAEARRDGKEMFYSLPTPTKKVIKALLDRGGSLV